MKRVILGCGVIKKDIEPLIADLDYEADVIWMDDKLHNKPEKLHDALQKQIDELSDYDEIILTFLLCGNGLLGIKSDTSVLRFLKGEDCIYANLCERDDYKELRTSCFFLSHGWLGTEGRSLHEFDRSCEKYGEKRARRIFAAMYRNYKHLAFMTLLPDDPGMDEREAETVKRFAELAEVDVIELKGTDALYRRLLSLEDDPAVSVIPKGHVICLDDTRPA